MAVLEKPTDVKVEPTEFNNVYNVSWKMVGTPALEYFKVRFGSTFQYRFTDAIPAANRSTIVRVTERHPGTIVEFYVYPFTASGEVGNHSDPASFVVPGGAFTFVCLFSLPNLVFAAYTLFALSYTCWKQKNISERSSIKSTGLFRE